ncbi:hypothetical protein [Streptomyces sp. NBC_00842]|uniref:hypothetical protein n=1 Tax=Streptomyces sp. NBC_00842 TaxID=2975848 RepID=UPI003865DC20|nr:hypothetical protein OH821_22050 [Streptomyces sp. NBC_00842]
MLRTAQISLDGTSGTVIVDGQDISHCIRGLTLTADANDLPALELDVVVHETEVDGQALVSIPARTAELLTALGWTRPADYDETVAEAQPMPALQHDATRMDIELTGTGDSLAQAVAQAVDEGLRRWERRTSPRW